MVEKEFKADDSELQNVIGFIMENLESAEFPPKVQMQMEISIEEIFVNIAHYAYSDAKENEKIAKISCSFENGVAEITFADRGIPYNPLEKKDPDITLSAEDRQIGGLGIFMVKKYMDDMRYEYKDGENRLTLVKKA